MTKAVTSMFYAGTSMLWHMTDLTTAELFEAAMAGDESCWGEMVERLSPAIWGAARTFSLSKSQASDVYQTVWLRLIDKQDSIRDPQRLAGWIATTARREALATVKASSRFSSTEDFEWRSSDENPERDVIDLTVSELTARGFERLGERCRQLLRLLTAVPKISYGDVSKLLDLPQGSLGPMRARCLDQLRATPEISQLMEAG